MFSRRQALKAMVQTSAFCGLSGVARLSAGADAPTVTKGLTVGISTLGFGGHTNAALAAELASAGFNTIQLFLTQTDSAYWKYNSRSDLAGLTPARCKEIANLS